MNIVISQRIPERDLGMIKQKHYPLESKLDDPINQTGLYVLLVHLCIPGKSFKRYHKREKHGLKMDNTMSTVINKVKTVNGTTTIHRKVYKCELCNFETGSGKSRLKDHIRRVHTLEKPFTCDLCDFASASKPGF